MSFIVEFLHHLLSYTPILHRTDPSQSHLNGLLQELELALKNQDNVDILKVKQLEKQIIQVSSKLKTNYNIEIFNNRVNPNNIQPPFPSNNSLYQFIKKQQSSLVFGYDKRLFAYLDQSILNSVPVTIKIIDDQIHIPIISADNIVFDQTVSLIEDKQQKIIKNCVNSFSLYAPFLGIQLPSNNTLSLVVSTNNIVSLVTFTDILYSAAMNKLYLYQSQLNQDMVDINVTYTKQIYEMEILIKKENPELATRDLIQNTSLLSLQQEYTKKICSLEAKFKKIDFFKTTLTNYFMDSMSELSIETKHTYKVPTLEEWTGSLGDFDNKGNMSFVGDIPDIGLFLEDQPIDIPSLIKVINSNSETSSLFLLNEPQENSTFIGSNQVLVLEDKEEDKD
jgi:hypothetical protein